MPELGVFSWGICDRFVRQSAQTRPEPVRVVTRYSNDPQLLFESLSPFISSSHSENKHVTFAFIPHEHHDEADRSYKRSPPVKWD